VDIFNKELSPECLNQVYPFYDWMIVNNPLFALISDQAIRDDSHPAVGKHE
jgi:hypothetical protein